MEYYLEYSKWDNVLLILFGILKSEQHFEQALSNIANLDPCFSSLCLIASPLASERHSKKLLEYFPLSRIRSLAVGASVDWHSNMLHELATYRAGDLCGALARLFSLYDGSKLQQLYCQSPTDSIVRRVIPWAMILAQGDRAFAYLRSIICYENPSNDPEVLRAIVFLKSEKVYSFVARLYVQSGRHRHGWKESTLNFLCYWDGYISIEKLLKTVAWVQRTVGEELSESEYMPYLLLPIKSGRAGDVDDWVNLLSHPNPRIADAARSALLTIGHSAAIQITIQKYSVLKPSDFASELPLDVIYLPLLQAEVFCKVVTLLLERIRADHSCLLLHFMKEIIVWLRNEELIPKLLDVALHEKCSCALDVLERSALTMPEVIKPLLFAELGRNCASADIKERAIIAIGLCGDESRGEELFQVFIKFISRYAKPSCRTSERDSELTYFRFLCGALVITDVRQSIPVLKKVAHRNLPWAMKRVARRALIMFDFQEDTYTDRRFDILLRWIRHPPKSFAESEDVIGACSQCVRTWPISQIKRILACLRVALEEALAEGDVRTARLFFRAISEFMPPKAGARFLDVLYGWPTLAAQNAHMGDKASQP